MEYREFTAKSADEAITQACLELGVTSDRLEYDVVQEATNGFLGIGSKPAIIRARARSQEEIDKEQEIIAAAEKADQESVVIKALQQEETESRIITSDEIEKRAAAAAARARREADGDTDVGEEPIHRERTRENRRKDRRDRKGVGSRREARPGREESLRGQEEVPAVHHEPSKPKPERVVKQRTPEEAEELKNAAETFLKDVFGAMGIEAEIAVDYNYEEGAVNCTFSGSEMGLLIGKRGQTLDSLQYLTSLVVNKNTDDYVRVKLDTEDYRSRRADTLNNLARNIAYKVKKTRRPVALEPMNPYERRIIHSALQGNKYVETYSEGEEPYRHVVVAPKW